LELYEGRLLKLELPLRKGVLALGGVLFLYTAAYSAALSGQMGRVDNRTACSRWIERNVPDFRIIAVIKPEWGSDFYSVEIDKTRYSYVVTGYHYNLLEAYAPDYLVFSEYEVNDARGAEKGEEFFRRLENSKDYAVVTEFKREISFLGLSFPYNPPGFDWLYFCPNITVYGRTDPDDPSREYYLKGVIANLDGDYETASAMFREAVKLQDSNPLYRLWVARNDLVLAESLIRENKLNQALQILDKAQTHTQMGLRIYPRLWERTQLLGTQVQIRFKLGLALEKAGYVDQAEKALVLSVEDSRQQKIAIDSLKNVTLSNWDESYKQLHYALVGYYLRQQRYEDAEKRLKDLLALDANNVRALVMLAEVYLRMKGHDRETLALLERAVSLDPGLLSESNSNVAKIIQTLKRSIKNP
ncbi:MAG: hypothetical protein DRG59_09390, partial [Deltaproteobacteria bacterium]